MVGAPPESIGKYGGDTDNWMWPRHTGDFALFRIYTAPDGSPAEYDEKNIPLVPKHHLPISLDGVQEGDFTMIMGYPGGTDRYLSSFGVKSAIETYNPTVVKIREEKDSRLGAPKLIVPSIQVNMRAGDMPDAEENGATYLKVPVQGLRG